CSGADRRDAGGTGLDRGRHPLCGGAGSVCRSGGNLARPGRGGDESWPPWVRFWGRPNARPPVLNVGYRWKILSSPGGLIRRRKRRGYRFRVLPEWRSPILAGSPRKRIGHGLPEFYVTVTTLAVTVWHLCCAGIWMGRLL